MAREAFVVNLENSTEFQSLLSGTPQTCGMKSGKVYLDAGKSCGQHSTNEREELLVFLAGQGQALIGAEQKPLDVGQGKVIYIPPQTLHDIKNTQGEPLVYIYCVAPASLEE